ncbi:MAG: serine hydroxymethyltransferase [Candidatus Magasanikbacteria bacterium]|nr:serine hydroxymethyltransferase [Candidatus Magasanikbacteria bacterium]
MNKPHLQHQDPEVYEILKKEERKQQEKLSMIPSENFTSKAIREVVGSIFMNKYSEGYPDKRYYEGNYNIDSLEKIAIQRVKKLFKLPEDWDVNVQPLSGSPANLAVYLGLLNPGDTVMGMYLPDGGHLSHGWSYEPKAEQDPDEIVYKGGSRKVNITSKFYKTIQYKTDPKTQRFDYATIEKVAMEYKPKLLITGGTAYPREINYERMAEIAKKTGAYYLADIAHEAGLVAAGVNSSPVGIADVVTFTTHKTLRCNRGAVIVGKSELMKKIDRAIFPGLQGGPHNHSIAGIAVGLLEAMQPEFKLYAKQIILNAQTMASELADFGFEIVSGGTDKHLVLINLTNKELFGKTYARALDHAGIITNMNTMPQEKRSPADPSALRIGTPWITTRGMKETEMKTIAAWMNTVMEICKPWKKLEFEPFEDKVRESGEIKNIADEVKTLCAKFPLDI